jgi:hypothetical protein
VRVQIISARLNTFWYATRIGQVIEVEVYSSSRDRYRTSGKDTDFFGVIEEQDCVLLTDKEEKEYEISLLEEEIKKLKDEIKDMDKIKLEDIVAYQMFITESGREFVLLPSYDTFHQECFTMAGLNGDLAIAFSDSPKSREDMLEYLNSVEDKKINKKLVPTIQG